MDGNTAFLFVLTILTLDYAVTRGGKYGNFVSISGSFQTFYARSFRKLGLAKRKSLIFAIVAIDQSITSPIAWNAGSGFLAEKVCFEWTGCGITNTIILVNGTSRFVGTFMGPKGGIFAKCPVISITPEKFNKRLRVCALISFRYQLPQSYGCSIGKRAKLFAGAISKSLMVTGCVPPVSLIFATTGEMCLISRTN